jgi:hypothetical protein
MISNSILSDAALDVATASREELHTPLYLLFSQSLDRFGNSYSKC